MFQTINSWQILDNEEDAYVLHYVKNNNFQSQAYQEYMLDYIVNNFMSNSELNVCIDAGANYGLFASSAAQYFKNVYSFEFQVDVYECLLKNSSYNKNITTVHKALGSSSGYVSYEKMSCTGLVRTKPATSGIEKITLDHFCYSPDLIKIDVEGDELEVLKGAELTIRACQPLLVVEIWNSRGANTNHRLETFKFLDNLGYKCIDCRSQDFVFMPNRRI